MTWEIEFHRSEVNDIFNYYTLWLKTTERLIPVGNFDRLTQIDPEIVREARRIKFDRIEGIIDTEF